MSASPLSVQSNTYHSRKRELSFPYGGIVPETEDLADANWSAVRYGRMSAQPQHPRVVAAGCSKIDLPRVQGVTDLGWLFKGNMIRGGRLSAESVASLVYPFVHLDGEKPPFLEIVVHSCVERGLICRSKMFDAIEKADPAIEAMAKSGMLPAPGIGRFDMPSADAIPEKDRLHARTRALKVLLNSPEILALVSAGELIVGEAYYETGTGKVHWLSFWHSTNPGKDVPEGAFHAIVDGKFTSASHLKGFHPAFSVLNALVIGNNVFTTKFELPVPTEVVVFGCADSRLSSLIMKTPHGLVEWMHNAGNVVDDRTLLSLRVALESAVQNIDEDYKARAVSEPSSLGAKRGDEPGYKRRAVLMNLSHSRCGAATATVKHLAALRSGHGDQHSDNSRDPAEPIVHALEHRFEEYMNRYQNPETEDEHYVRAAEANAVGGCLDILGSKSEHARAIRKLLAEDRAILVPAYYLLNSGVIQMLPPLDAPQAEMPGADPRVSLPVLSGCHEACTGHSPSCS